MLIEGGIYNSKQDDSVFVMVQIDSNVAFGFDIGYYNATLNRSFILEELRKGVEDLQEFGIGHAKFWYADEADSIVDGYFGCVNQNTLNILTDELYYSDAYAHVEAII